MKLNSLRKAEAWERHLSIAQKRLRGAFRERCESRPVFVLGKQRSGTTMLIRVFHRHPDMLVLDEHRDSSAFIDYRLRSIDTIRVILERARYPAVCLKPICDSHRIRELYREFPHGLYIWLYRDFEDVANSSLRKFDAATRAIRLVCTGQPGGGWFREGVSPDMARILQQVYAPDLHDFDLACLTWWARNRSIIESGLADAPGVTIFKYEALASEPVSMLKWLFQRLEIPYCDHVHRNITARSIGRHPAPAVSAQVRQLCRTTLMELDQAFHAQDPPATWH